MDLKLINKLIFLIESKFTEIVSIILFFILISIFDLIGLSALGAFIAAIIEPNFLENIFDFIGLEIQSYNKLTPIIFLSLLITIIFIFKSILSIFIHYKIVKFSQMKQMALRMKLLQHYKNLKYEKFISEDTSEQTNTIGNYVKIFGASIQAHFQFFGDIIVSAIILIFLISINPFILMTSAFIFMIFVAVYKYFFLNKLYEVGNRMNVAYSNLYRLIAEYFDGLKELRILNSYKYFQLETKTNANEIAKSDIHQSIVSIAPRYILETLIIFLAILLLSFYYIIEKNILDILPIITIFGAAVIRLAPIINQITRFYSQVKYGKYAVEKIFDELNYSNNDSNYGNENYNTDQVTEEFISLKLENVQYQYPSSSKVNLIVNDLQIRNGEAIAIIGGSGAGKTTLVDLMLGLLPKIKGTIKLNGEALSEDFSSWWKMVAYLPQEVFLINASISLNIALGLTRQEIDYERLNKAIKHARLDEYISSLPDGIETNIGQRGIKISGGQKQRIALARTFYFNRQVIILDEATNSIDYKVEDEIYDEIKKLKGSVTLIIISHRIDVLNFCDKTYIIENGKVMENNA